MHDLATQSFVTDGDLKARPTVFSAIRMLKGLRTLYVQSAPNACSWTRSATGNGSEDLTGCKHCIMSYCKTSSMVVC